MPLASVKKESLEEEVDHVLEESRMVLPGIQALFGFQLIAVFNQRFSELLLPLGQARHVLATILIAIAIALIMAPAAYHRLAERGTVSRHLADVGSRTIAMAMLPLLAAISLEVALVTYAVSARLWVSLACGVPLSGLFMWLWFLYPAIQKK